MLKRLSTIFGIVLLGSSFAFAAQAPSTQPTTPKAAQAQSQNAPVKKHHAKKHHKKSKKRAAQTKTQPSTTNQPSR
jgi:hypothetical protein